MEESERTPRVNPSLGLVLTERKGGGGDTPTTYRHCVPSRVFTLPPPVMFSSPFSYKALSCVGIVQTVRIIATSAYEKDKLKKGSNKEGGIYLQVTGWAKKKFARPCVPIK